MTTTAQATLQEATRRATDEVGAWASALRWDDVPAETQDRLALVLLDLLGVTVLGARQPEQQALVQAWRPGTGPSPLVGGGRCTGVEAAAWLNATALVRLELDEGNKHAAGHCAAHGFPAVLALAADLGSTGADTLAALVVAYEVSARFGRATRLRSGAHPHGSWGVTGAAAGCARLMGLSADRLAAAVDAGAGLPVAGHFASALDGNPVRDAWMGASNTSGLAAARMAAAGQARSTGTAAGSLGGLLGELDPEELTDGLGERWDIGLGYFKRHASCSFTHPVADAVLRLRRSLDLTDGSMAAAEVREVVVETHRLATGLDRARWDSRLAAMFSIPFITAAALVHGEVGPAVSGDDLRDDPRVLALASRVVVRAAPDLDARLPHERAARVTVRTSAGEGTLEVPNPVGDADHHPLDESAVVDLLTGWLDDSATVSSLRQAVVALPTADDVGPILRGLA